MRLNHMAVLAVIVVWGMGCASVGGDNSGQVETFAFPKIEEAWIRNGESLVFEEKQWFPADDVEVLTDAEVYQIGDYKGVPIFVEKVDTRPFNRIYTKFAKGKYRYFERIKHD